MSCNVSKAVLRVEIPHLKGKLINEVYPYYIEKLGIPDEVDEYQGEIEYFEYKGTYQAVRDYNANRWGADLVLHHESDYKTYVKMKTNGLSFAEFEQLATSMSEIFEVDKSTIRLISYTWYNGADEPIHFD